MRRLLINTRCPLCGGEVERVPDAVLKQNPHFHDAELVVTRSGLKQYIHSSCWDKMIEEKKVEIDGKEFVISKLPATVGREILYKYTSAGKNILTDGSYAVSEEVMLKMMSYVGVYIDNRLVEFKTADIINNHVKSAMTLLKLEKEMWSYNFDFFTPDKISTFFTKLNDLMEHKTTEILTDLLGKLSQTAKQLSEN